jgi:hypothetical protein
MMAFVFANYAIRFAKDAAGVELGIFLRSHLQAGPSCC